MRCVKRRLVGAALVCAITAFMCCDAYGLVDPSMFSDPVDVTTSPPWSDLITPGSSCVVFDGTMLAIKQDTPTQIYTFQRNASPPPQWIGMQGPVPGLGQSWTNTPSLSPDKQWLYYTGSSGDAGQLYRSPWKGDHWDPGQPIDPVNSVFSNAVYPFFTGQRLYYMASPGGNGDIYYSNYDAGSDTFSAPLAAASLNGPFYDAAPRLTLDGQTIFWMSDRPGGFGGTDIWMASWNAGSNDWTNIINAGSKINTILNESFPSWNGARNSLYFERGNAAQTLLESKVTPEPSTLALLGVGAISLLAYAWRRWKRAGWVA